MRFAGAAHLRDDGAGHHVARRQFVGEAFAAHVLQRRAFAAQRLAEQEPRSAFERQGGGMELDELDIADFGARAIRHSHAVAGGDVGIGGVQEYAAQPAGGQQHGARSHRQRVPAPALSHTMAPAAPSATSRPVVAA